MDPYDFEHLVADLWEAKGYETTVSDESGDKGIDVIARRPHSDETVVIQAKRYAEDNTVGSPEVQQYAALKMQEPYPDTVAIVTTSSFTDQAVEIAADIGLELIDGTALVSQANAHLQPDDDGVDHAVGGGSGGEGWDREGDAVIHRGHHYPAGTLTFGDYFILGVSIVYLVGLAALVFYFSQNGLHADRTTDQVLVVSVVLLLPFAIGTLLSWDDVQRSDKREGWFLGIAPFGIGALLAGAVFELWDWAGAAVFAAGILYPSAMGILSVVNAYRSNG